MCACSPHHHRNCCSRYGFLVTAEQVRQIEQYIGTQVVIFELRIIHTASPARHLFASRVSFSPAGCTFQRKAVVHQTNSYSWSKPFTYSNVECRRDTFAKTYLLVVVAKHHLRSGPYTEEPVIPEVIGFHFVLVITVLHGFCKITVFVWSAPTEPEQDLQPPKLSCKDCFFHHNFMI